MAKRRYFFISNAMLFFLTSNALIFRIKSIYKKGETMAKVLVLYYSSYGHIEAMAQAVAGGAQQGGADVDIMRVPELVPEEVTIASGYKRDQSAPIAKPEDLKGYDAIIFGTP